MCIGIIKISLAIDWAFSLKDKRQAVKSITNKLKNKFNISISEVDHHQYYNRALIAIVMVGKDKQYVEPKLHHIVKFIEQNRDVNLDGVDIEFY
ncbi:MAG: hypothetical protein APR63_03140 [Desulfuromonas sp. SDB]|nr:MAG: hypothetical protein APR63_03140 [Desulfuromonas sp. SDB]